MGSSQQLHSSSILLAPGDSYLCKVFVGLALYQEQCATISHVSSHVEFILGWEWQPWLAWPAGHSHKFSILALS